MTNPSQQQISIKPWILEVLPFVVVLLIAAHVSALISYGEAPWTKKEAVEPLCFNLCMCWEARYVLEEMSE
ncbi:hypothetical protein L1987_36987 [Smallanthus sonchifolius]|uniref:Uncharacterized protein n=1 Tax=Smallanthus sonchifolius TaxID=185202 RepID=A0ACB9HFK3_9ASTR|nr:hypothetical protein L1987_36987 [Smallanthus sonchifolius]